MSRPIESRRLSYEARARIADNLFVLRRRADYSQEALGERAMVSIDRIGKIERGDVVGPVDTYVRLAGSLSVTLGELLAGVRWTPGIVELQRDPGYEVEFEVEPPKLA
ncbi:MAG TPA: helix-turn-helix transcriptional regulator [Thermoanaerobaculia bacterium]|nr:helix-turn-helix transcriptional regulator [Thermoanaerobaculia bacterium]